MLTTTLQILKDNYACAPGYKRLIKGVGSDYPKDKEINLLDCLQWCTAEDVIWALRAVTPGQAESRDKISRLIACDISESVLNIFEDKFPGDDRPRRAIKIARGFANGSENIDALRAARAAAYAADAAAYADAAYAAAYAAAADAAADAAYAAAADAAADAAYAAAYAAAAYAAADAAYAADAAAAYAAYADDKQKEKHKEILIRHLSGATGGKNAVV